MRIKALEDWDYIPEFGGNRKEPKELQTVYRFRVLSGREELELRKADKPLCPESLESVVVSVKNPPVIVAENGKETEATINNLTEKAELKGLYMELIIEYGNHSALDAKQGKG